ncbi:MAG: DUF1150 family protein [Pseudomonadota bacterium]
MDHTTYQDDFSLTRDEFTELGLDQVGYIRLMTTEALEACFPGIEGLPTGHRLWTLFGADGEPIVISDHQDGVLSSAMDRELEQVSLH